MRFQHLPVHSPLDVTKNFEQLQSLFPISVTSLPSGPTDGQEIYYIADSTNGVIWHLRYRAASASAYKWEFVGGPPLSSEVATGQTTNSATFVDLGTVGPSVTTPLAGDWWVLFGNRSYAVEAGCYAATQLFNGAGETGLFIYSGNLAGQQASGFRQGNLTAVASGNILKLKYQSASGGGVKKAEFLERTLSVVPIRVG